MSNLAKHAIKIPFNVSIILKNNFMLIEGPLGKKTLELLLNVFLNEKKENEIVYSGLDINEKFYDHCIKKYPEVNFFLKDININDEIPNFDYIVCNGTFTEKRDLSYEEMFDFMSNTLKTLWSKTNKGIAFNVMSKLVDWERDDLFHVSMDEIGLFLKNNLSKNFVIRNDYKLYEYTIYVYK